MPLNGLDINFWAFGLFDECLCLYQTMIAFSNINSTKQNILDLGGLFDATQAESKVATIQKYTMFVIVMNVNGGYT